MFEIRESAVFDVLIMGHFWRGVTGKDLGEKEFGRTTGCASRRYCMLLLNLFYNQNKEGQ